MASRAARDVRRLIANAERRRDELQTKYDKVRIELEQVEAEIAAFELTLTALDTLGDEIEDVGLPTKQIRNEMVEVLRDAGSPMHYGDIYDELLRRGIPVPGKDPRRNVGAHLSNDERFVSLGSGKWGLASWKNPPDTHSDPLQRNVVSLRDRVRESRLNAGTDPSGRDEGDEQEDSPHGRWADVPF